MQAAERGTTRIPFVKLRWRRFLIPALVVFVIGGAFGAWYAAFTWVSGIGYASCMEHTAGATPKKCRCLADNGTDRMLTYEYIYRELTGGEGFTREEINRMKQSCGLSLQ
jgi:hypothetical protein